MAMRHGRSWVAYSMAVGATAIATIGTWLTTPLILPAPFAALFFAAVAFSAWFGGIGPALCATILATVAIDFFFFEPPFDLWPSINEVPYLLSFGGAAILVTYLTGSREQTRKQVDELNEALQQHVHELETLLEVIPVGIGIARDPQGKDIRVNPYFAKILNVGTDENASLSAPEDQRPDNFRVMRDGKEVPAEQLPMQLAASTGKEVPEMTLDVVHNDGRVVTMLEAAAPLFDAAGKPRGSVGVFLDITERRRTEEELRAANAAKDHFLAVLSHELRTPLTPVLAIVSMLDSDPALTPALRDDIAMIRRNIELEARLIDDLLDLTRITRGKLELHRQPLDVRQILEHAVEIACAPRVAVGKLKLNIDFRADRRHVQADSGRLTQLFWNLLSNAVKFTPDGGRIGIAMHNLTENGGDWLVIEITDSGMGIEPDMLPKIFDAFEQGHVRITRDFGGLGLGLAIGKAIVELHGGKIAAFSEGAHRGSKFIVHLPLCAAPATPSPGPARAPLPANSRSKGEQPLHILLVEDHEDSAKIMALVIRRMGHDVSTADSVSTALTVAAKAHDNNSETRPIDLVVSDIGLPDGSGLDLMRQLAAQYKLKGIALTGHGLDDDHARSRAAGFIEHLTKPVNLQRLETVIRECTQRR